MCGRIVNDLSISVQRGASATVQVCRIYAAALFKYVYHVSVIDGDEDVTTLDVVKSITVSGSDKVTVELPVNDYVIWVTAVEDSKGTIETKVVKK